MRLTLLLLLLSLSYFATAQTFTEATNTPFDGLTRGSVAFSSFTTLRLKLRGVEGGERIQINEKDKSNPNDGSETKVSLMLTIDGQGYEIPLSLIAPIQLEEIYGCIHTGKTSSLRYNGIGYREFEITSF